MHLKETGGSAREGPLGQFLENEIGQLQVEEVTTVGQSSGQFQQCCAMQFNEVRGYTLSLQSSAVWCRLVQFHALQGSAVTVVGAVQGSAAQCGAVHGSAVTVFGAVPGV